MKTCKNPLSSALICVLITSRQLEAVDKRAPVEVAVSWLELRGEDHRAAIHRVDTVLAVIAPSCQVSGLRAASQQD